MSLTASMWTGVSGLLAHGEKMNVVGNNIANVNTIGFKSQRMDFEDLIYASSYSASGPIQVGRGVGVEALFGDFSQGATEASNTVTDMAIGGNGFFKVVAPNSNQAYYTRAGNFRFNSAGYLHEPHGYVLQGWAIDNQSTGLSVGGTAQPPSTTTSSIRGTGLPVDIQLRGFTVEPKRTDTISVSAVLTADDGYDKSKSTTSPFTALFQAWDGRNKQAVPPTEPLAEDAYAYAVPFKTYDEAGTAHELTVFYDQVTDPDPTAVPPVVLENLPSGAKVYEYMVTMDPTEDMRKWEDTTAVPPVEHKLSDSKAGGILMAGVMIFNSSGQLISQTAYTWCGTDNIAEGTLPSLDPNDPASWKPTAISNSGYPTFVANFTGVDGANTVNDGTSAIPGSIPTGNKYMIQFDMGLKCTDFNTPWTNTNDMSTITTDYNDLALFSSSSRKTDAVVNWSGSSSTKYVQSNGYTYGDLLTVKVDQDGVLYATYTNQVTLPLYQIALYDFVNKDGLYREGGNLFTTTLDSGEPSVAAANTSGMGKVNAYSIEQSNVDLAKEFVNMITTQRGFQANGKVITTTDTMLETVIGLKR